MELPLAGVRIVDCSAVISGPLATTLLADQGADVIKVEPPLAGDVLRAVGSSRGGMSGLFHVANRGKRSIALNLAAEEGREILRELAARADVFVQNFRPGVVERMGIGYADLRRRRPDLVYVSISGFGRSGPYAGRSGYDLVAQGEAGLMSVTGTAESAPLRYPVPLADMTIAPLRTALIALLSATVSVNRMSAPWNSRSPCSAKTRVTSRASGESM